ncbi:hypothetical protein F5X98DRAFT_334403 [Xylaria grammica]|nr:hypothetical protein F5X98DRAFT_334403 [Xylaria grammica]
MMAAIPIRRGVRIRRQRKIDLTIQLIPGKNNPGLQPLKIDHTEKPKTRAERYGQSKLYIPGRGEINTVLLEQTYHLQQVREVLKILGEERAFISRPWLLEIMRLHNRLESQRSEIKKVSILSYSIPLSTFARPGRGEREQSRKVKGGILYSD